MEIKQLINYGGSVNDIHDVQTVNIHGAQTQRQEVDSERLKECVHAVACSSKFTFALLYHAMWRGGMLPPTVNNAAAFGRWLGERVQGVKPDTVRRSGDFNKVSQADEPIVKSLMERLE